MAPKAEAADPSLSPHRPGRGRPTRARAGGHGRDGALRVPRGAFRAEFGEGRGGARGGGGSGEGREEGREAGRAQCSGGRGGGGGREAGGRRRGRGARRARGSRGRGAAAAAGPGRAGPGAHQWRRQRQRQRQHLARGTGAGEAGAAGPGALGLLPSPSVCVSLSAGFLSKRARPQEPPAGQSPSLSRSASWVPSLRGGTRLVSSDLERARSGGRGGPGWAGVGACGPAPEGAGRGRTARLSLANFPGSEQPRSWGRPER